MVRSTRQREAIRQVFGAGQPPLTASEILALARRQVPQLGIATVYRAVKALLKDGTLASVELPGEVTRYELANKQHHHYFRCRGCGRVYDINFCLADFEAMTPGGFKLEGHELILYGRCAACTGSGGG